MSSTPADDNPFACFATAAKGDSALPEIPLIVRTLISSAEWSAMSSSFRYLSPTKDRLDWPVKTLTQPTPNWRRTVKKRRYQGPSGLRGWRLLFACHFVPKAEVAPCQQVRDFRRRNRRAPTWSNARLPGATDPPKRNQRPGYVQDAASPGQRPLRPRRPERVHRQAPLLCGRHQNAFCGLF